MAGTLFVVATPIGNLEDITARALRVLRSVAIIAAEDTRRTAGLLAHFGIVTPTVSLHEHNEAARTPRLVDRLRSGDDVAVVSDAGTPTVSDPGQRLVHAAVEAGIRVEPVPGPSAVLAAIAASGFEAGSFTFLGFPPIRLNDRKRWFDRFRSIDGLAVFFEAPHRIKSTLSELASVLGADVPIVVGREMTKIHEELVRGPISRVGLALSSSRGEFTVVVEIGHKTNQQPLRSVGEVDWLREFGEITKLERVSKRRAIGLLAKRTGIAPNEVYAKIEHAKKLVK